MSLRYGGARRGSFGAGNYAGADVPGFMRKPRLSTRVLRAAVLVLALLMVAVLALVALS